MTLTDTAIASSYDYRLVALSVFIAILASHAALDLSGRVTSSRGKARLLWLAGGSVAMGIGIWSMHYIGMLAFRMSMPVQYDWPTVLLSLFAAVFASAVALFVVSRRQMGMLRASIGSIFMGGGIAAMHYIGMEAIRMPAMCHYSAALVVASIVLAIVISFVALWLTFHFRRDTVAGGWLKFGSAVVMGLAIPVMHYTGMAAAHFTSSMNSQPDVIHSVSISLLGGVGIGVVTFIVLGLVILTSLADRRFSVQSLELESSEQRYRQIVETALDSFVESDSHGLITDWNAQAEQTFGWSRSEVVGRSLCQTLVPSRYQDERILLEAELLRSGQLAVMKKRVETVRLHRDGHEFPVELSISVIHGNSTIRFGAFLRDITDRKRAEQELIAAKEAAEAASRAKSEFLANMSHEIRTPLNGVMGMVDLALETELTSEQREYLETVKLSGDSLVTVINDVLDFSKIEAGKVDLELNDFDLRDNLESTLKTLALRADEKSLELLCDIAPSVPDLVRGDSNRLRQVLVNLLGNAIKFTDQGEVSLNVSVESESGEDRTLHFIVADSGIGISAEKQVMIFQPFAQGDNSTTRKYGGTGLGLTISRRLVGLMGGRIWVESVVGKGTRFHFTIRLKTSDKAIEVGTIAAPERLRNVKVLVVDDNRTNRRILEAMLKRWGMKTTCVDGGEKALTELLSAHDKSDPFGLVLTDMHMPKMDGFSLIEQIRQRPELCTATIMMLTSAGHRGDGVRCEELGVAAYLLKPIRQTELREAVARVLESRSEGGAIPLVTRYSLIDARDPATCLRVLVAEDNPVNQLLAKRLLEKRGHVVKMTTNGRETLDALAKDHYDIVLMDVQMPEMDGIEATLAIRQLENLSGDGVRQPIVALTAHAMKGDQERCLAAGMDAFISKPIRRQDLDAVLEVYVARRIASTTTPETVELNR